MLEQNEQEKEDVFLGKESTCGSEHRPSIFTPGSIHAIEVRNFWTETLKCSPWILGVLQDGYRLPSRSTPEEYEDSNNASVNGNLELVESILLELESSGVIAFIQHRPHCVNPLGLVTKVTEDGVKHRLVLDASGWLNLHIDPPTVRLAHLDKALGMTRPKDFQVVFDLKSAYHNVKIAEEHIPFLGAAAIIRGQKQYLVFRHLPFGLNSAVHAMTKLWKPLTAYLHSKGMRFSIYIDDGRILATSKDQAENFRQMAYETMRKAGWILEQQKSDGQGQAAQCKKYLGFMIDTVAMAVFYPEERLTTFCKEIEDSLKMPAIPVRILASILGKLISLEASHV